MAPKWPYIHRKRGLASLILMMRGRDSTVDHLFCKEGAYGNSVAGKVAKDNGGPVTIVFPHGSLASALAAGLATLGWAVRGDPAGGSEVPVVLVTDNQGRLQLSAVSASSPVPRLMILVGGLACLGELADGLLLGASAAVNADLPFPEVLSRVNAALQAGPLLPGARDRLRGRLRQRKAESDRFGRLTDREGRSAGIATSVADLRQRRDSRGKAAA
jgi:hypothetical protein